MVAKMPYLMQTMRLAFGLEQPTSTEVLICIYNLTMMKPLTCGIHLTDFMTQLCAISDFRLYWISCNYRL